MKNLFCKRILIFTLFFCLFAAKGLAECTVYFFVDFTFWRDEYVIRVNGRDAFKLEPEVDFLVGETPSYKKVARKVVFTKPDTYVISCDCATSYGIMTAELNLNLEDDTTYYVLIDASLKNPFFAELLTEKKGLKLLKKAQKDKKYTINEDLIYDAK